MSVEPRVLWNTWEGMPGRGGAENSGAGKPLIAEMAGHREGRARFSKLRRRAGVQTEAVQAPLAHAASETPRKGRCEQSLTDTKMLKRGRISKGRVLSEDQLWPKGESSGQKE